MHSAPTSALHRVQAPTAKAATLFYDYLAHRANEGLSYAKLRADAVRTLETLRHQGTPSPIVASVDGSPTTPDSSRPTGANAAFDQLIRPLLRTVTLSFRGDRTYGLTTSQLIVGSPGRDYAINIPDASTLPGARPLAPGIVAVYAAHVPVEYPRTDFDLLAQLRGLPTLDILVETSEQWAPHELGHPREGWLLSPGDKPWTAELARQYAERRVLLFRVADEPTAPRVLSLDGRLYRVPSTRVNPAALPLCFLLDDCTSGTTSRMFEREGDTITVRSRWFPAELERALWLGHLLRTGQAVDGFAERRTYTLSADALRELDRVLLR